ncbi:hypothetical protein IW261DRAFT_1424421 [Armillaria novae-zelandiae]|uniref:Uncharacterized protein n=1 Tax=Armillaria novae-zelandiae TaxID=153914 RepID=A0AA39NV78_9AGAR|nr:hypothetical protein IW261DRAFT_1424421 [Armillaria novae-zelandiae]
MSMSLRQIAAGDSAQSGNAGTATDFQVAKREHAVLETYGCLPRGWLNREERENPKQQSSSVKRFIEWKDHVASDKHLPEDTASHLLVSDISRQTGAVRVMQYSREKCHGVFQADTLQPSRHDSGDELKKERVLNDWRIQITSRLIVMQLSLAPLHYVG